MTSVVYSVSAESDNLKTGLSAAEVSQTKTLTTCIIKSTRAGGRLASRTGEVKSRAGS